MHRLLVLNAALVLAFVAASEARGDLIPVADEVTWETALAAVLVVDFELFEGLVTTEYPGIAFSPFNGGSPIAMAAFSHSGGNSLFTVQPSEGGGGWSAHLDVPVQGFALWTGDVEFSGTTIALYDAESNLLGSFDLLEVGGGNGPFVWGFNGFLSDQANIDRVELTVDPADAVWFDDVEFSDAGTASVPDGDFEPKVWSWGQVKSVFGGE